MIDIKQQALRALKLMDADSGCVAHRGFRLMTKRHHFFVSVVVIQGGCIYPRFIPIARKTLREQGTPDVRIARHGDQFPARQ